jgi:protein-disulfide isomerase
MTPDESSKVRNPLLFVLCVIIAALLTGGAVWYATRHMTPTAVATTTPAPAENAAAAPTTPAVADASAFSDAQKTELQALMKDYLMKNPDVLMQSLEAKAREMGETQKEQTGRIEKVPDGLYDYPLTPFVGPKDAKLVVVEFFDYNCGFCKRVVPDYTKVMGEEPDVKFMFKELPILSDESQVAARFALAANKQGKYMEFHTALMEHQGPVSTELLETTAKDIGLDMTQLKKDVDGQDVRDALQKNMELAQSLGVQGTPYFIIGKERVPGAIGYSRLKDLIAQERAALDPKAAVDSSVEKGAASDSTDTESASPTEPQQDEPITE